MQFLKYSTVITLFLFISTGWAGENQIVQDKPALSLIDTALHLVSYFDQSFSNHSYCYASSNDRPNYFASYSANSGSLVKCRG